MISESRIARHRGLGDYEVMGDPPIVSGECAAGDGAVLPNDPYMIRYHPAHPGGIFHASCAPTGDGWYGLEDEE